MNKLIKTILAVLLVFTSCGMLFALSKQAGISNKEEDVRPPLFDTPSYVELTEDVPIVVRFTAKEDAHLGELSVVLVNTDSTGNGTVVFELVESERTFPVDPDATLLFCQGIIESDVPVGAWYNIGNTDFYLEKGKSYTLTIKAEGCNPYFIKTQSKATDTVMPFTEKVFWASRGLDDPDINNLVETGCGLSIGVSMISDKPLTYGDIFYFSRIIIVLAVLFLLALIILGKDKIRDLFKRSRSLHILEKAGNDIFLVLLFALLCCSIYINGYLEGINISADSAGYLREAVNMAAGRGFHFDSLAGYDNSWFANWPILYPLMIAAVMKVTGFEVYAASKVLSMILVGILILVLRFTYKKDAWFYGLLMTNLGLMYLYWYSWSELPFILFMVMFVLMLSKALEQEKVSVKGCIFLGLSIVLCFLTRYFGMFTFGVMGFYILLLLYKDIKAGKKLFSQKVVALAATSVVSGLLCLAYLVNNKIQNGMPSGVSRSMWWDDYQSLTNDLVKALLAEIFNLFHLEVPAFISGLSYDKGALIVILVVIAICVFAVRRCMPMSRPSVFITASAIYYGMFIIIRYFSSMDTFYYRFFAPATFLLTLGLTELILTNLGKRAYYGIMLFMTGFLGIFLWGDLSQHILKEHDFPYYEIVQMNWDEDYQEIPDHSVVIFSTLDYRSQFYRPDVVEGLIEPGDTMDDLRAKYFGSKNMCILTGDARAMLESGIYDKSVNEAIESVFVGDNKYCIITLNN